MSGNLIQSATRDVLLRAAVAAALIVGMVAIAVTTARAEPGCNRYDATGACVTGTVTKRVAGTGLGRPADCYGIPWCGCWARHDAGLNDSRYNLVANWYGLRHVDKQVGAYALMRRRGGGHVGRVVAIDDAGNPVILSGNHNGGVGRATYPASRVLAYVRP